jgi:hypothetical protein
VSVSALLDHPLCPQACQWQLASLAACLFADEECARALLGDGAVGPTAEPGGDDGGAGAGRPDGMFTGTLNHPILYFDSSSLYKCDAAAPRPAYHTSLPQAPPHNTTPFTRTASRAPLPRKPHGAATLGPQSPRPSHSAATADPRAPHSARPWRAWCPPHTS